MAHLLKLITVKQGLYSIFEVFVDTILVCTLTALVVLTRCRRWQPSICGSSTILLAQAVFGRSVGSNYSCYRAIFVCHFDYLRLGIVWYKMYPYIFRVIILKLPLIRYFFCRFWLYFTPANIEVSFGSTQGR